MLLAMGALMLVAVGFCAYYLKLMFPPSERQHSPLPLSRPIE
jgi:hypothetical protein